MTDRHAPPLPGSFWMAGFEGADHVNLHGHALDMVAITGHAARFADDYAALARIGIRSVRESVGWRVSAPRSHRQVDLSRMLQAADAAATHGIDVVWSLMHYGTPPDVQVTDPDFAARFADFAGQAARALRRHGGTPSVYNPINEIGFLSWALAAHAILNTSCTERDGYVVKLHLVRAALLGMQAIRAEDPGARFMHIEPLIHVVPPEGQPELAQAAADFCGYQWQVWDLLSGILEPQLGGTPDCIDWIGVNHYHDAQWEIGTGAPLSWRARDPRRRGFASLLQETWDRYRTPVVVAETGHTGDDRAPWLDEIAAQTEIACDSGVRVDGFCLYPAVDRPDWNDTDDWHHSGIWDAGTVPTDRPQRSVRVDPSQRHIDAALAATLRHWQSRLPLAPAPPLQRDPVRASGGGVQAALGSAATASSGAST